MIYPRVLIISLGRVNASDTSNNGLLLRNLFDTWPKKNLAQIYSSGDNIDEGFFGQYFQVGPKERQFGSFFYKAKKGIQEKINRNDNSSIASSAIRNGIIALMRFKIKNTLVDSGIYELIFRPRLSKEMLSWVNAFNPDIIFAQGYNLFFTWLPLMLAANFHVPIAYYPTDDWPNDLYRNTLVRPKYLTKLVRKLVITSSNQLVNSSAVRIAFNPYMQATYCKRYSLDFFILMHGDDLNRFANVEPHRLAPKGTFSIVSTGVFDKHRLPLLHDLDQACVQLNNRGVKVQATVFPVNFPLHDLGTSKYLHFAPCPSHNDLTAILRGADILFLPERFDETAKDIMLCISSKAHLFMFSGRPTIVYSDPVTGIARYAREEGWAEVVDHRDPESLEATIEGLINNEEARERLSTKALVVARRNHDLRLIQMKFLSMMSTVAQYKGRLAS